MDKLGKNISASGPPEPAAGDPPVIFGHMRNKGVSFNTAFQEIQEKLKTNLPAVPPTAPEIAMAVDTFGKDYTQEELNATVNTMRSNRHFSNKEQADIKSGKGGLLAKWREDERKHGPQIVRGYNAPYTKEDLERMERIKQSRK